MPTGRLWSRTAHGVSLARLLAGLLFAAIAFQPLPLAFPVTLYVAAMISDLIDGQIARREGAESYIGGIIDLISDKSLTIVSLLFAAACRVSIEPLALIGVREVIMLGARLINVDGRQIFATNRVFGGLMAALLWSNTLALLVGRGVGGVRQAAEIVYWVCAIIFTINLVMRSWEGVRRLKASAENEPE